MKKKRRGSMLIQQLILIGLSGVVTLVAVQLIHRSLSFAGGFQSQFNLGRSTNLLVRQFREDLHDATSISQPSGEELVMKILGGNEVTYRIEEFHLERREIGSNMANARRDQFAIGPHCVASFDVNGQSIRLTLARHAPGDRMKFLDHKTMVVEIPWASVESGEQPALSRSTNQVGGSDEE
ncbi:hypothetical protein VN12_09820 [Pirellula sp. SH-Sr6A]|uniref:hypothetical protein n=1 Tax=Pirellula sp. SH-Sr6A TaxID=1632865 RepID=UPI00078BEBD5|nr:hypothetical protein [Pirellula sp. SH-Sr6A]AMV32411.1 hypothetical protein VN12_09820 [Pirellula sp. SH-Sr6A]